MTTLDRYVIRETLPPLLVALALLTFVMAIQPMLEGAEDFLAKGMPLGTVGFLLLTLLPQALGVTIPIAFLTGLLMALGRLSSDREGVALLACGVSPLQLLRPIALLALVTGALNLYVMVVAIPDSNHRFLEVTYAFMAQQGESDIKPRQFYEGFPGKVLHIQDAQPGGGWSGVMLADTSNPARISMTLADSGRLVLDHDRRDANLYLTAARQYRQGAAGTGSYELSLMDSLRVNIPAESVFGSGNLAVSRGLAEKHIGDLREDIAAKTAAGLSPHNEIMYLHQKFSFPVACLIFAPIALALGLHTRREGKLGGMVLGLAVVFVYYGVLVQAEAWTKGQHFPAEWARWVPNIVLGAAGALMLLWKSRTSNRQIAFDRPVMWFRRLAARWRRHRTASAALPAGHSAGEAVAVVIRIPDFYLPRPRLLDLYVSSRYLRLVALSFVALLGLSYLGAFLDRSEKLFKGQADFGMLLQFLWYYTPQLIAYIVPIATLIAVLGTIGGLTRTGELTVMRACGVSLYRAALPLMLMAAVWSGLLFVMEERVLAHANQKAEALDDVIRGNPAHTVNVVQNRHWLAALDGRLYYYLAYEPARERLHGLSVFETDTSPYRVVRHTHATVAEFREGVWHASKGWMQDFSAAEDRTTKHDAFEARTLDIDPPEDFTGAQVDAELMTYSELRDYIERLDGSGFELADQRTALQSKLAFPAVTLVMTLIAVPFGVTTGRRGALYGIGIAIMLAISYFLLVAVFTAAGRADVLPPVIAAWAANVFFIIAAAYLTLTART
jgi:LPS export ABC transporter permease LptG/LPS export ABC transporter permease LptF